MAWKGETKNARSVATRSTTGAQEHAPGEKIAEAIDLNEQLVKNKTATFYMKVNSDVMSGAGICCGDVVIVDRSLEPSEDKIVIAVVDEDMLIRKLEMGGGRKKLVAVGKKLSSIDVTFNLNVWGVVTYVIRKT